MLQNEIAVPITLSGGNETTVEGHVFFENIRDRDGTREGFVEKFLYWKLCITPWEVAIQCSC